MKRTGFTLIELMVVILIVAILAAVIAPMLSGRINEAKWTEGKAGAGTLATAIRAYMAETESAPTVLSGSFTDMGIADGDLDGKYFSVTSYEISDCSYDPTTGAAYYTITVTPDATKSGAPSGVKSLTNNATTNSEWGDATPAP